MALDINFETFLHHSNIMYHCCNAVEVTVFDSSDLTQDFYFKEFSLEDMINIFPKRFHLSEKKMNRYLGTSVYEDKYFCNVPIGHKPIEKEMREIYNVMQNSQLWKDYILQTKNGKGISFRDWSGREEVRKMYLSNSRNVEPSFSLQHSNELLYELLTLCDNALENGGYTFDDYQCAFSFPLMLEEDYNLSSYVIKLCKKYGMLKWQNDITDVELYRKTIGARKGTPPALYTLDDSIFFCFSLSEFVNDMLELYGLYLIWRIILSNGKEVMITAKNVLGYLCYLYPNNPLSQSTVEDFICYVSRKTEISELVVFEKGKPIKCLLGKNPIEAAKAQMLGLVLNAFSTSPGLTFSTCANPSCQNIFTKDHGNKKLCPNCNTGKDRVRIHRGSK